MRETKALGPVKSVIAGSLGLVLAVGFAGKAHAADYMELPVVKPVMPCGDLANADISHATDTTAGITSATILQTPKGAFCKVSGTVAPQITFEADLPIDHWTQRFTESAMGRNSISNAGGCTPALNGEFALAADNLGHSGNGQSDSNWTSSMQARIDYAYRANHETALATKALIKIFYGQSQRFAYFVGCSEGGREALEEAERYPADFNGIAAGAPVAIDNVHNSFYHPWEATANTLVGGARILAADRLSILHAAVIQHCAAKSGVIDGMLQEPTACSFDPAWVQCKDNASDTSTCLTAAEVKVAAKLYEGPSDGSGDRFEISGCPMGSELQWRLSTATAYGDRETDEGFALKRLVPPPESNSDASVLNAAFAYTQEWHDKIAVLAPLYNAANTNLQPFQARGGHLILWQGAEDTTVQPAVTVAYYEGVQKQLGASLTDSFLRYFLLPGVGHCGGGEGAAQIDVLSPLMAWTETHQAPAMIVAGKTMGDNGPAGAGVPVGPGGRGPGAQRPPQGGPGGPSLPYAQTNRAVVYTRPIYPFPNAAAYTGTGDRNDAANYKSVRSPTPVPQVFVTEAAKLFGPDNQKFYHVENGQLVAEHK